MKKFALTSVLLVAFVTGVASYFYLNQPANPEHALVFPKSVELPEFKLTNSNHQEFTKKSLLNKWSLFFFGYTNCPDVCPTELYLLSKVIKNLEENKKPIPQITFVSLDPQRDTPEVMKNYLGHFHRSFLGVTGEHKEIEKLTNKFGVIHEKVYEKNGKYEYIVNNEIPDEAKDKYLVNHSARIMIVSPEGKYFGAFRSPHDVNKIASDMARLQN